MKKIIFMIAVVLAGGLVFYYTQSPNSDSPISLIKNNESSAANSLNQKLIDQGEEILKMLNFLNDIELISDLFENPIFLSLSDFSVSIPKKEIGKRNPFSF